jgi:signal transduction histidine kinase
MYQEIVSAKEVGHVYSITVKYLAEKVGFDRAVILKKQDHEFIPVAIQGYDSDSEDLFEKLKSHFFAKLAEQNHSILVNEKNKCLYSEISNCILNIKSFIAIPFAVNNEINHILFVGNETEETLRRPRLTESDQEILQTLSNQIGIVIGNVELHAQTQEVARIAQAHAQKLKEALYQLQQTQAQLIQTEKMSSLGQLVAGVAHEINNPVTFISGNLNPASRYVQDLLGLLHLYQQHYPNPPAPIQEEVEAIDYEFLRQDLPKVLDSMKLGADRITQIVRSLRNFSRTEQAQTKPFNIHEGIDSTLLILQHRLKPKGSYSGIQIVKEYGDLPLVECYASQLNQVFMNILSNGIDALENQKEARVITISTEVRESSELYRCCASPRLLNFELEEPISPQNFQLKIPNPQSVIIRIRDNGPGMTETVKKHLFDPFFTTKPVGKGTGLGLSISYQIVVEKHGGFLTCRSQPGQGAEFWIEIPLAPAESQNVDQRLQTNLMMSPYLMESVA